MEKESKYTKLQKIGQGAYGAVYKAINHENEQIVALKVSIFDDCEEGVPSTCLRQIAILKNINHPNLIRLLDAEIYRHYNPRLQMAFEFIDFDLSKYIRMKYSKNQKDQRGITEVQSKKIIKSILSGIQYLHYHGVLHRDLKPQNILISKEGDVKIADMGLGRIVPYPFGTMSKEIQTLWYRAPQLLMGWNKYGMGVDIWSIGCIFYELVQGYPLFQSESQIGQIFEIFKILGTPKKSDWPQIVNFPQFKVTYPKFTPNPPMFKRLSYLGQQFLWKLLKANPQERMGITQALNDKYMKAI